MYNNQNNGQMNPANPNGGYVKPGQRPDQFYGNLTITPELLAEIQRTGKVRVNVNELKTNQYGPARRVTLKPYVAVERPQGGGGYNQAPAAPQGQNFNQAPNGFAQQQPQQGGFAPQNQAPQAPIPQQAPMGNDGFEDQIPFN